MGPLRPCELPLRRRPAARPLPLSLLTEGRPTEKRVRQACRTGTGAGAVRGPPPSPPQPANGVGAMAPTARCRPGGGAGMSDMAVQGGPLPQSRDVEALARELSAAYKQRVLRIKAEQGLPVEEAVAKADEPCSTWRLWQIKNGDPETITWADLQELVGQTGWQAADLWEYLKRDACAAFRDGHWAAATLEGSDSRPWQRALFLAMWEELTEGWQPRNGVERQLIDLMAQAQMAQYIWQQRLSSWAAMNAEDAAEQAGAMVERYHRMFLRTLRALCGLRKV